MPGALYRELVEILERAQCRFQRQAKGSHEFWRSPVNGKTFSIPNNITSRRLANQILKEAGLPTAF
jgi:predicted RNA binding protein YcfA (HicA-like mRNA interferase family)